MSGTSREYYEVFAMTAMGETIPLSWADQGHEKHPVLYFTTFSEARTFYDTFREKYPKHSIKMRKRLLK